MSWTEHAAPEVLHLHNPPLCLYAKTTACSAWHEAVESHVMDDKPCVTLCGVHVCRKLQSNTPTRRGAAKDIASASVVAAAEIYDSMYVAAQTVLKQGGTTTSQFVGHK